MWVGKDDDSGARERVRQLEQSMLVGFVKRVEGRRVTRVKQLNFWMTWRASGKGSGRPEGKALDGLRARWTLGEHTVLDELEGHRGRHCKASGKALGEATARPQGNTPRGRHWKA